MDAFVVDELFDFSGDDHHFFSSSNHDSDMNQDMSSSSSDSAVHLDYSFNSCNATDVFTDHFCVPSEDVAELEWLSNFVDESFTNFPANNITGTINYQPENPSFHSKSRSKRTRPPSHNSWTSSTITPTTPLTTTHIYNNNNNNTSSSSETIMSENDVVVRRCTHCASEKTPQWRSGPLGPKTLCNACGVRFKSGRLVPEYRPAASPTFVLTRHSNSHRKIMELRRQKETMFRYQQQQVLSSKQQMY